MATHCITRLRFNLKDDSKADLEALKTLDGALGAQVKDGQWQVIIGASVGSVYDELEPMLGRQDGWRGLRRRRAASSKRFGSYSISSPASSPLSFPHWWREAS
ncbi:MAG: PTS transporter subunit EIIB [Collinsella sp.]